MFDIVPHSVHQKMYRVREHFEALEVLLGKFYRDKAAEATRCHSTEEFLAFSATIVTPARLPLVVGDCLQNMRSSLDYLVWELVKANNRTPNGEHMFPISRTSEAYEKAIGRGRLSGLSEDALALIKSLQPYLAPPDERDRHMLSVLDRLTNVNKHRHIIGTMSVTTITPLILEPRFALGADVREVTDSGAILPRRIQTYIAFDDSGVAGLEMAATLDALSSYLIEQVFSKFRGFF